MNLPGKSEKIWNCSNPYSRNRIRASFVVVVVVVVIIIIIII
jgi:hypothetical protein